MSLGLLGKCWRMIRRVGGRSALAAAVVAGVGGAGGILGPSVASAQCSYIGCCDMFVSNANPLPGQTFQVTIRGGLNPTSAGCSPYRFGRLNGQVVCGAGAAGLPASTISGQVLLGFLGSNVGSPGTVATGPLRLTAMSCGRSCNVGGPGFLFGPCPTVSSADDCYRFNFTVPAGAVAGTVYTFTFAGTSEWISNWVNVGGSVFCPTYNAPVNTSGCTQSVTVGSSGPPSNDNCTACTPLPLVPIAGTPSLGATVSGTTAGATPDGASTCDGGGIPDVWYCVRPLCGGLIRATTCGSPASSDTVLSVHTACPGTPGNEIVCNDDDTGVVCSGLQSTVTWLASAGVNYWVRVADFSGPGSPFVLNVTQAGFTPPANNQCVNAAPVGNVINLPFNTCAATTDGPASCGVFEDIWYRYIATVTGQIRVDTCGSLFDTAVAVYCSPCPVTPASQIACNNDNGPSCPGTSASVQFPAVAGTAYWIRIGGNAAGVVGAGDLTIAPVSTGVPNDACSAASPIGLGVYNGTTIGATPTAGLVGMCGASNATRDVWYIFTAPCTAGVVTLHTCTLPACSSTYDTVLSVHSACPSSSSNNAIVCNDDAGGPCGLRSRVSFTPVPCRQYLVRVSGFAGQSGNFVLTATQASVAPPNNNCAAATVIAGGSGTTTVNFTTCGASNDGPNQCVPWSRDIWYRWTAPCSGPVTMDTFGSGFDTVLSAYPGAPCPPTATSQIACNDDAMFTLQSQITFPAVAGTSYLIRLSGFGNSSGCGVLHIISPPAACPGCPPSLSTPVPGSVFTLSGPVFGPTVTGKWRVRVNCCMCFENCNFTATGVSTIPQLVAALVADINARVASAGCPASSLVATQPGGGANLVLKHRCPGGGALSFSVGAAATPCTGLCTIVGNNFFTNQPCQFNPFVEGQPESGTDCDGDEIDDLAAISAGLVDDLDGNGIPDTCTGGARGACCSGAVGCTVTTQGDCPAPGSFNLGVSCAPDSDPCGKGLPCAADYNQSGAVTVQDIFDFLAGYFSGDPAADFNGVGGLSVQDIFDFLAAYFTGCP